MEQPVQITWRCRTEGFDLKPMRVVPSSPVILSVDLESLSLRRLEMRCTVVGVPVEEGRRATEQCVLGLLGALALAFPSCRIGEPYLHANRSSIVGGTNGMLMVEDSITFGDAVEVSFVPGPQEVASLTALLEAPADDADHRHAAAFRLAAGQTDPTARYMLLYTLLLTLHQDRQELVDCYIHSVDKRPFTPQPPRSTQSTVAIRQRKDGSSPRMESLFTRLRNEISHARVSALPQQTLREIREHVGTLQALVHRAVMEARSGKAD